VRARSLGRGGPEVSVVGLGCNNFAARIGPDETRAVVEASLDAGITLFDTADMYGGGGGSEELLGQSLGGRRGEVLIATKWGFPMKDAPTELVGSRLYIRWALANSLKRLGTDYVDVYQMHVPDPKTPVAETLAALDELVREGLVRHIGCSNFTGDMLREADDTAKASGGARFVSVQNHYSLLYRDFEADAEPVALERGIGVLPYFPLAQGMLTGKYRSREDVPEGTRLAGARDRIDSIVTDDNLAKVGELETLASQWGVTLLDIAIGGLAAQPSVSCVIAGATKPEQVRANVAAGAWEPTPDQLAAIDAVVPSPRS
jgi:aryl-alcohol dehydrogenase-like predicted oxidoreductase